MTELLCVEMMTRQLQAGAGVQHLAVLAALAPWMENLSFAARWEGAPLPVNLGALCSLVPGSTEPCSFPACLMQPLGLLIAQATGVSGC